MRVGAEKHPEFDDKHHIPVNEQVVRQIWKSGPNGPHRQQREGFQFLCDILLTDPVDITNRGEVRNPF